MKKPNPVWIHNLLFWSKQSYHLNHLGVPSNGFISHLTRKVHQLEERVMASKNSKVQANEAWKTTTFVQYRLSREDKAAFEQWSSRKEGDVALDIAAFMSSGAKTSITWDTSNNVWIVSATMRDEDHKSYNQCLTSRSDDWYEAMRMNAFKALVLAGKNPWSSLQSEQDWG